MKSNAAFATAVPTAGEPRRDAQWGRVTPLLGAGPWLTAAFRKIGEFAELPENWDGYGSPRLGPVVVGTAIELVSVLCQEEPPPPQIVPVSGGGLQLEWHVPGRELEVEILPDGSLEFLAVADEGQEFEGRLSSKEPSQLLTLVKWLVQV